MAVERPTSLKDTGWRMIGGHPVHIGAGHPGTGVGGGTQQEQESYPEHTVVDFYGEENKVTSWPAGWGEGPGTYIAYRSGPLDTPRKTIFFAPDQRSAGQYASLHGEYGTHKYEVTIKNPAVFTNQYEALAVLTGVPKSKVLDQRNRAKDGMKWHRDLDKKLHGLLRAKGYDALVLTRPALPALRELAVVDKSQIRLKE